MKVNATIPAVWLLSDVRKEGKFPFLRSGCKLISEKGNLSDVEQVEKKCAVITLFVDHRIADTYAFVV